MIANKRSEEVANNIDKKTATRMDMQEELKSLQIKLDAATKHMSSIAYKLAWDKLNAEYLRLFNLALKTDDAHKSKYALEAMKGVLYAKNIYVDIKAELADKIYNIETALKEMQDT